MCCRPQANTFKEWATSYQQPCMFSWLEPGNFQLLALTLSLSFLTEQSKLAVHPASFSIIVNFCSLEMSFSLKQKIKIKKSLISGLRPLCRPFFIDQ
jgi:hypothetical protein